MSDLLRNRIDQLLLVAKAKELDIKVDTEVNKRIGDLQRQCRNCRSGEVPGVSCAEQDRHVL